jgi:hypothetical protein
MAHRACFEVTSCSFDDGPAIAKVHISAFWTDPTWVVIWPGKTREYVISQSACRMSHTLLSDRTHRRHQKVVETETGAVVGYSRWTLPKLEDSDLDSFWPSARVPGVSQEQEHNAESQYETADYEYDHSFDELDKPLDDMMNRIRKEKKYFGKFHSSKLWDILLLLIISSIGCISCSSRPLGKGDCDDVSREWNSSC